METKGPIQYWIETLIWLIIGFLLITTVYGYVRSYPNYDDTDDVVNKVRSGMVLHIDYGTGCEYLSTRTLLTTSDLIPRRDEYGKHICW